MRRDSIKLSERVKKFRKENNLTQSDLANMLFVSKQAISKWENERSMPDVSLYPKIAKLLHISVDELMENEVEGSKTNQSKSKAVIVITFIALVLFSTFVFLVCMKIPSMVKKNVIKRETEKYLKIDLPKIKSYQIIEYNEWLSFNNTFYPMDIYYFIFEDDVIQIDETWIQSIPQDMIEAIPLGASEYPYICDYYKLVDTTTNKYNKITSDDDKAHKYSLYCFQIQSKRLIAIKFEV